MKRILLTSAILAVFLAPAFPQENKENADFKLAVNLYDDKLYDLALEQFRQFINQYPNSQQGVESRFYLGLVQTKLGKFDDARFTFQNFALTYSDHPRAPEAWINVAESYVSARNFREAAMAYERMRTFHPKSKYAPPALVKAADNFDLVNDPSGVRRVLRTLTQEYTSSEVLPARLRLAQIYLDDGEPEAVRTECRRVLDVSKDEGLRSRALLLLARANLRSNRLQEAEQSLQEIIKNLRGTSSYYAALVALGDVKKSFGSTMEAVSSWRIAADDSVRCPGPVRQLALLSLGQTYQEDRDFKRALASFERAAAIRAERSAEAWFRAASVAERIGETNRASEYFGRAYADTSSSFDRRALAVGAFKGAMAAKDYNEAIRIGEQFERAFPSDPLLARVIFETGKLYRTVLRDEARAARNFERVPELFPTSLYVDDALFEWSLAKRQAGAFEQAVAGLENLKHRFPSSSFADDADDQILRIKSFDIKDRDAGLQNLALLVGDVIAQQSKGNLSFRLAEISARQLNDYANAAAQYDLALQSDLEPAKRPAAWFGKAQALELSALREQDRQGDPRSLEAAAAAAYDSLLRSYPVNEFLDQAVVSLFRLRLRMETLPAQIRKLSTEFLGSYPTARRKDLVLLAIAKSLMQGKNYDDAAVTFKLVREKSVARETAGEAMYRLGVCMMEMGNKDSADAVLRQFLADHLDSPFSASAASLLASAATERGDEATALRYLALLEKQFFYTEFADQIDLRRGDAAFKANDHGQALAYYGSGIARLQSDYFAGQDVDPEILFRLGVSNQQSGKNGEAKKMFAAYLSRSGSSQRAGDAYLALAAIAKSEKNLDLAAKYLQEAGRYQKEGKERSAVALEAADLFFKNEQFAEAVTRFGEAAQQTKDTAALQFLTARIVVCYYRLDNTREAEKRVEGFRKNFRNADNYTAEFEFERGKYLVRKEDLPKAKAAFDTVRRRYPKAPVIPDVLYWTARVFELDQKPQEAIRLYDTLLQSFPASDIAPRAMLGRGNVYYALESWEAASKDFRSLIENEGRAPDLVQYAMNNLILTYKELGLFDGALELTRKYIERFPNEADVMDKRIDIGVLYQKLGYYDQSALHLQGLLQEGNADLEAELRYYIGEAHFYKGDHQQAILEFLKVPYLVTKRGPVDWVSTSYYMAGQAYEKMSKYDQAVTMYKQIVDRKDTDAQFKTAAQKEIDRVKPLIGK